MTDRTIRAVIFDLDGLLLDSEVYWERARRAYAADLGCHWTPEDELEVKGANSPEWAAKIRARCPAAPAAPAVIAGVTARMRALYDRALPLLPGATEAVRAVASNWPAGVASSSPPDLIAFALREAGVFDCFRVIVSADTAGRGKPAPDVFLAAARELGVPPENIAVFEDSSAGITAAHIAGMLVVAVPNAHYPPTAEALACADLVLPDLTAFRPALLRASDQPDQGE